MPWCQQGLPHCGSPGGDGEALAGAVLRRWGSSLLLVPVQSCRCSCPSPVVKRQRDNNPSPRRCCRTSTHDGISRKLRGRAELGGRGVASAGQKQTLWLQWDLRGAKSAHAAAPWDWYSVGCCGLEMMAVTRVAWRAGGSGSCLSLPWWGCPCCPLFSWASPVLPNF